jgi:APA family basic amino acid/polyamine antiporter
VLVLSGTYNELITYVVFVSWVFYAMSAAAVFVLRKRQPDRERPYRAWGHPWTTLTFIAFAIFLVVNSVLEAPRESLIGLAILLAGIPAFVYWRRQTVL